MSDALDTNSVVPGTEAKVAFLSDPATYADRPDRVEVIETHMSWVFLTGHLVFKLKKPVKLEFLDFSTLKARRKAVHTEARLNQQLAGDIYRDPLPLTLNDAGHLALDGDGRIVDWLVVMQRLPEDRSFEEMILQRQLQPAHVAQVVEELGEFYSNLPPEPMEPDTYIAKFESEYARNKSALNDPAFTLDGARLKSALEAFEAVFDAVRPFLAERVRQGRIIEGHGDLRPEHVFFVETPVFIDRLEFNRQLRLVDPFEEVSFLGMEAARLGEDWVFAKLIVGLMDKLNDRPPPELISFYWRHRALLRARLAIMHLADAHPRTPQKWRPLTWRYVELSLAADTMTLLPEDQ